MIEHGYIVVRPANSGIGWPNFWQPVHPASMPQIDEIVWVYCPELGNDADGYGQVMLARQMRDPTFGIADWRDIHGSKINPAFWANVLYPKSPFVYPTPEAAIAKAEAARRNVVEGTDQYARQPPTSVQDLPR